MIRTFILAAAVVLTLSGLSAERTAWAIPSPLLLPFSVGETWYVCQGYNGQVSHQNTVALDLSLDPASPGSSGCTPSTANSSTGRAVRAPGPGNAYLVNADLICINFDAGGSSLLGHMGNRVGDGSHVNAGDQIGTVDGPDGNNDGYGHIHVQAYSVPGCGPAPQLIFAGGGRFLCAPDMPYSGAVNQYSGTALAGCASCPPALGGHWTGAWEASFGASFPFAGGTLAADFTISQGTISGIVTATNSFLPPSSTFSGSVVCDQITFGSVASVAGQVNFRGLISPDGFTEAGSWDARDSWGTYSSGTWAGTVTPPQWRLPFHPDPGLPDTPWTYTKGPHAWDDYTNFKCTNQRGASACSSLDFQPLLTDLLHHPASCDRAYAGLGNVLPDWAYPVAGGTLVSSAAAFQVGHIEIDHTLAGFPGWHSVYEHVQVPAGLLTPGQFVYPSTRLGHPSCVGAYSSGPHLHVSFSLNGPYYPIAGAVSLCGWTPQLPQNDGPLTRKGGAQVDVWHTVSCGTVGAQPLGGQATTLAQGQSTQWSTSVPAGQVLFGEQSSYDGSQVATSLTTPSGVTIDASTVDPNVTHLSGAGFDYFEVRNPEAGIWTVSIYGVDMPVGGEIVSTTASSCAEPAGDAIGSPCLADDDGDGITDADEINIYHSDPLNPSTAGDGYTDGAHVAIGKDPRLYCKIMRADVDGDGVVSILDLSMDAQRYLKPVTHDIERLNQDGDTEISILDLAKMASVYLKPVTACP